MGLARQELIDFLIKRHGFDILIGAAEFKIKENTIQDIIISELDRCPHGNLIEYVIFDGFIENLVMFGDQNGEEL